MFTDDYAPVALDPLCDLSTLDRYLANADDLTVIGVLAERLQRQIAHGRAISPDQLDRDLQAIRDAAHRLTRRI